ncbi:MAG: hypothetical protein KJS92_06445, partial [Bacteroidetes bacterium]|nr:hypothetical protein [Bacteroidota bacterium]
MYHKTHSKLMPLPLFMVCLFCICVSPKALSALDIQGLSANVDDTGRLARKSSGLDQEIEYHAEDSIIFDLKRQVVHLYNKAYLKYGSVELEAYYIMSDLRRKELFAKGGFDSAGHYAFQPVLHDGDDNYTADSMRYNSETRKGKVYGLRLVEDEAIISCNQVFRNADGSFLADRGKLTTCNAPHPHFYFDARKLKVIPNNKVIFGPANLVVEDMPTPLALPFGLVPTKKGRRNGVLFPSYGFQQNRGGFYLENLGYYTGLGDNRDLTLSGAVFFNGDYRLAASSRFVKRYRYQGDFNFGFSVYSQGEKTSKTFFRQRDFNLQWKYTLHQNVRPGTRFSASVDMGTPGFKRINSNDPRAIVQSQFNSSVSYGKTFLNNRFNLNIAATHNQNTANRSINFNLPNLSLNMQRWQPFLKKNQAADNWIKQLNFTYNLDMQNRLSTYDSVLFSERYMDALSKLQSGLKHSIPLSTIVKLSKGRINITPAVSYQEWWYMKSSLRYWDAASKKVLDSTAKGFTRAASYAASISASTNIYGTFTGLNWGRIRALRHVITPTLNVSYRPDFAAPRFKYFRSVQTDSTGKKEQYSIFRNA